MMNRMSFSETIFLFFLALIVFGPKRLPEIARQVAKYMNEFKRASNEFKAQIEQEIAHLEVDPKKILSPAALMEGVTSRTLQAAPTEASVATPASETPTQVPAAQAAADDEPLFATTESSTQPAATSEAVTLSHDGTAPTSQESHV